MAKVEKGDPEATKALTILMSIKETKNDKTMSKKAFKQKIKEMILAEMELDINDNEADAKLDDFLYEAKKKKKEEEAPEEELDLNLDQETPEGEEDTNIDLFLVFATNR
jgi:hypothetical protein